MFSKSAFLSFIIHFPLIFLLACSVQTEADIPTALPSNTKPPTTVTLPTATDTSIPPSATLLPSLTPTSLATQEIRTLQCEGEGSPAIVLLHGCGSPDPLFRTNNFYTDLSKITQTCGYQRGKTITAAPNTLKDMVSDLHARIINAQLTPPFVIVAHSCGGWISIVYAATYPEEVAGMVLLDSAHPDYPLRAVEIIPKASPGEPETLTNFRNGFINWYDYTPEYEAWDYLTNAEQVRAVTSLGNIPLLVLTASEKTIGSGIPEVNERLTDDWINQHKEMAALSTDGRQMVIENTGHLMWWDNPAALVNQIRSLIKRIQQSIP
jgi:pimeloyl-ACP methyl ester carboxylesterase